MMITACVRSLAVLGGEAADEPAPEGAEALMLWLRVQRVCRDAIGQAEDVLGATQPRGADAPQDDAAFGYVWMCLVGLPAPAA